MAGPGLYDPLGTDRGERGRPGAAPPTWALAPIVLAAAITALLGFAWLHDDGDRGEPRAVVPIAVVTSPTKADVPAPLLPAAKPSPPDIPPGLPAAATPAPSPPRSAPAVAETAPRLGDDDQDVEIQNGVRVIRPHPGGAERQGRSVSGIRSPPR